MKKQHKDAQEVRLLQMEQMGIEIKQLSFAYTESIKVLLDISFSIGKKESVGLIGANGVGKSTTLKLMAGLLSGYSGKLVMHQMEMDKKHLAEIRKKTGYVFQDSDSQLFLSTVYEDVAFAPRNYGYAEEVVEERVIKALQMVGIEAIKDRQIYRLSGGQKKLASIATILSVEPEAILLDEPSVGLDPRNRKNLIQVLNQIETLKVIASHDLDLIWDTCERTILLSKGRIIKDGRTEEILMDEELLKENGLELPLSLSRHLLDHNQNQKGNEDES